MSPRPVSLTLSIGLAAMLAAGCSQLPTEPVVDVTGAAPAGSERPASPAAARSPVPPVVTTPTSATLRVNGNKGGSVSVGQFTVDVPRGAFAGYATITVSQPDPGDPRVDLDIWPASKNAFAVPVTLIARLSRVTEAQVAGSQMHELDRGSGGWVAVSGQSVDARAKTVRAPLLHFSSYRVEVPSRAGWKPVDSPIKGR